MKPGLGATVGLLSAILWTSSPHAESFPSSATDPASTDAGGFWRRTLPPARTADFATAFDSRRNVWVMAGMHGSATAGEIWSSPRLQADWTASEAVGRVTRGVIPLLTAYDAPADRLICLLTTDRYDPDPLVVWELDRAAGDVWRPLTIEGSLPARRNPVVTFDPVGRRLFLFGGWGTDEHLEDVWVLTFEPSPRWSILETSGTRPLPRIRAGLAFAPERHLLVLHGGDIQLASGGVMGPAEDLWFLDVAAFPPAWRQIVGESPDPTGYLRSQLVLDPPRDRILTFGRTAQGAGLWEMSLSTPGYWRQVGSGFPVSLVTAMAREPDSKGILMLSESRELWRLDLETNTGLLIDPGSEILSQIDHGALVLDPRDGSVLSIGLHVGYDNSTGRMHYEHRLARYVSGVLARWDAVTALGDPPARSGGSAVWDARRRRWIVLGGSKAQERGWAEPWVLESEPALAWRALSTTGGGPMGTNLPAVYDRERDRVLVLEEDPATRGAFREEDSHLRLWSLRLDGQPHWTLEATEGRGPTGRGETALTLDERRRRILLFGGRRWVDANALVLQRTYSDVWALPLTAVPEWHAVVPMPNPIPPSIRAAVDVDPWFDRLRLLGGSVGQSLFPRPFDRDSARTVDLGSNTLDPVESPSGLQEIGNGSTIFDPVSGRATHFGARDAFEWTTAPRFDVRLTIRQGGLSGDRGRRAGERALEVIVHGDSRFDPSTIDIETVRIAGSSAIASPGGEGGRQADVDGDGFADRRFLAAGIELSADEPIELRAQTSSGVRVIGFARRQVAGKTPGAEAAASPGSLTSTSPRALSARILRGAIARLSVDGGAGGRVDIHVFDVRGRLLWSARREREESGALTIDLPTSVSSTPGIRFVRIRVGNEIRVLRHVTLD